MERIAVIMCVLLLAALPVGVVHARDGGGKGAAGFTGTVTTIDHELKTMTLRDGSKVVRFDITNFSLKGFRGLHQVKPGRRVTVRYRGQGIIIVKGSKKVAEPEAAVKRKKSGDKYSAYRPTRVQGNSKGLAFADVDENQDGRISPVELSVPIPGLTRDEFKTYDKNGDGLLDRTEFNAVRFNR
jgi:hypothetical protein